MNLPRAIAPLILPLLATRRIVSVPPRLLRLPFRAFALTAILTLFALTVFNTARNMGQARAERDDWESLGRWAREQTSENAIFLLPVSEFLPTSTSLAAAKSNRSWSEAAKSSNILPTARFGFPERKARM
jgi:hypothetical protein